MRKIWSAVAEIFHFWCFEVFFKLILHYMVYIILVWCPQHKCKFFSWNIIFEKDLISGCWGIPICLFLGHLLFEVIIISNSFLLLFSLVCLVFILSNFSLQLFFQRMFYFTNTLFWQSYASLVGLHGGSSGMFAVTHCLAPFLNNDWFLTCVRLAGIWL